MGDSIKFGPEWLRNMSNDSGGLSSAATSSTGGGGNNNFAYPNNRKCFSNSYCAFFGDICCFFLFAFAEYFHILFVAKNLKGALCDKH